MNGNYNVIQLFSLDSLPKERSYKENKRLKADIEKQYLRKHLNFVLIFPQIPIIPGHMRCPYHTQLLHSYRSIPKPGICPLDHSLALLLYTKKQTIIEGFNPPEAMICYPI